MIIIMLWGHNVGIAKGRETSNQSGMGLKIPERTKLTITSSP